MSFVLCDRRLCFWSYAVARGVGEAIGDFNARFRIHEGLSSGDFPTIAVVEATQVQRVFSLGAYCELSVVAHDVLTIL